MTSLPLRMLFHAKEPLPSFSVKIFPFGKNISLKNRWNREFLSSSSLHTCFANIASLNFCNSLNPIPPRALGRQSVLHFDQCMFLWFPRWPHQNFRISYSMSLHNVTGSLKQLMAKVGMACTTTFNSTSLPAWERSCSFHPCNLAQTRSLMNIRLAFLFLPTKVGRLRYFSSYLTSWTPRQLVIKAMDSIEVDLLKKREVFDLFNCWPEALS